VAGTTALVATAAVYSNAVVMPIALSTVANENQLNRPMAAPTTHGDHERMLRKPTAGLHPEVHRPDRNLHGAP
jgi:hypothetical protein